MMSKASSSKGKSSTKSPPAKKSKIKDTDEELPSKSAAASSSSNLDLVSAIELKRKKVATNVMDFKFNKKRCRIVSKSMDVGDSMGGILYWMSRDQRVQDNWALLYAQRLALKLKRPLHVCFCLVPKFLGATIRHFGFMLKGIQYKSTVVEVYHAIYLQKMIVNILYNIQGYFLLIMQV
jgi:deoxyribodipyrimidine photo-lyase